MEDHDLHRVAGGGQPRARPRGAICGLGARGACAELDSAGDIVDTFELSAASGTTLRLTHLGPEREVEFVNGSGSLYVIDVDSGAILTGVSDHGHRSELASLAASKRTTPLPLVATGNEISAYRLVP